MSFFILPYAATSAPSSPPTTPNARFCSPYPHLFHRIGNVILPVFGYWGVSARAGRACWIERLRRLRLDGRRDRAAAGGAPRPTPTYTKREPAAHARRSLIASACAQLGRRVAEVPATARSAACSSVAPLSGLGIAHGRDEWDRRYPLLPAIAGRHRHLAAGQHRRATRLLCRSRPGCYAGSRSATWRSSASA